MVLNRDQYYNMRKEELIQELADINSRFVADINTKLSNPSEKCNESSLEHHMFISELQQCKKFNSHLLTRITQLRHNAVTNLQYSKRETTEFNLVPVDITEDVWKENIGKALSLTGVNIIPDDLHACH